VSVSFGVFDMEKSNEIDTETRQAQTTNASILQSYVKEVAESFWKLLIKERNDAFLDADVKDVAKAVLHFLSKDIIGRKIILLDDEKLITANAVARVLKRKRSIIKTNEQKLSIAQVKKIYKYLHNPVWQNSAMVRKSRAYLDSHLRRMTPVNGRLKVSHFRS